MKVLAIDTSNLVMGISVLDEGKVLGEYITNLKKNHSIRVMPAIEEVLNETGVKPAELDRIVVAKGPGSYTGVRIGVTIAKTLAWTLKKDLVGISSLEVLAQSGKYFDGFTVPLFDARRTQLFTGLYGQNDAGDFQNLWEDRIILLKDWLEKLQTLDKKILFVGNDLPLHQDTIKEVLGDQAVLGQVSDHNPRPSELGRIGMMREPDDIHTFIPSYLQLAEAEVNWLKSQGK
ncbi:tRNA (adenosine(37)-N6)-threonylcarbamoyltransferase complex dimerization subunit type 1 TsaB [Fictibacillus barbaricus]|uniref:tRNA (Adenosine(37)-N6)-threonylcarbamoyltransferase complex dimerization subunit type 1 TsaB n=1 Tax=Fictibacillus barbaricus TaxID=182136 RepID=A0ABS2Z9E2_9BACL|nr:tRNA (adenosine(37)-N6)-threonylcarbamoyltransferase complex dimerization subunit type 1 TsaB [Fictibacillus barbaricus]MBN3543898.1 tRNA (adenosine(37)-N6)-threonylcarbamoyltransferase complex dimerization subunit type 1 TsaB [Fictibacillus barbaricus]GGB71571.1 tRNA (adenosine(37)-N6)-threonylcarbamoyltransferase complex dimerization subunit type 1 TsaB [Fictibacillus barbaricus]